MKKGTFLNELSNRINKYPDHNDIIQYYNELIQKEPYLEQWFKIKLFSPKEMFVCKREILNL